MTELLNAGTTLALNETGKKLDRLTFAIYMLIALIVAMSILGYWFMDYFNIIDYVAYKMKGGC